MSRYAPQKSVDDLENMLRLKQSDWLGARQEIDRLNTELSRLREQNAELRRAYWLARNAAAGLTNYCEESGSTRRCERELEQAETIYRAIADELDRRNGE